MKRMLLALAIFTLALCAEGQGNGVLTITVTNTAVNITTDRPCNRVLVRENSASPSAIFSITLSGTSTAMNFAAGTQYVIIAPGGSNWAAGTTIATIVATTSGPFTFTGTESIGQGSYIARTSSPTGGGGGSNPPGPQFIQAGLCSSGGANCTIAKTFNAGDHVIVAMSSNSGSTNTLSVSDTVNTYNVISAKITTGTLTMEIWEADNVTAGARTITCSATNTADFLLCQSFEIYDGLTTSALDQIASASPTSTTAPSSGASPTTTQANELVFGFYAQATLNSSLAAGSGFTLVYQGTSCVISASSLYSMAIEMQPVFAKGAQTATFALGTSASGIAQVLTFL
jgi:hypothetical protein